MRDARKGEISRRRGRPRNTIDTQVVQLITQEWLRQGRPGVRPVAHALPQVPVRVIRKIIGELKLKERQSEQRKLAQHRIQFEVIQSGTVMALDGAKMQHQEALVLRDRGSNKIDAEIKPRALKSQDVLASLHRLRHVGRLPLILQSDNGAAFRSHTIQAFCRDEKIVTLVNLPRTPQHNGACEVAVRELREALADGTLQQALYKLNYCRKRRRLGYQTAMEFDAKNTRVYTQDERARFYAQASLAIECAVRGTKSAREMRKREREAIMQTAVRFKLATLTRGGRPWLANGEGNA